MDAAQANPVEDLDLLRDLADDALRQLAEVTTEPHFPVVHREHTFTLRNGQVYRESRWRVSFIVGSVLDPEHVMAWGSDPDLGEAVALCTADFARKWLVRKQSLVKV